MILADENLNYQFILDLREAGYEVLSITEKFSGISDPSVIDLALEEDAVLITEDKDFGELIFAHQVARLTIVFLRYSKTELALVRRQLLFIIQEYLDKEGHYFITIARGKIRITTL